MDEEGWRREIVTAARRMNALGINQGTSGNIGVRAGDAMLITPSAIAYEEIRPEQIARMPLEGRRGSWDGPCKPSSEWRMHRGILLSRPDAGAVVHCHATFATVLAIARREIPAVHYMVAVFGGANVRCAPYALFGSEELARNALDALEGRTACLLANHGMIALGETLAKAMWRAVELETLARQYYYSLLIGGGVALTEAEVGETLENISTYGVGDRGAA
ncbi:MAG: class II aldolase/adducin family protein [Acetobacteraceae bacterium]